MQLEQAQSHPYYDISTSPLGKDPFLVSYTELALVKARHNFYFVIVLNCDIQFYFNYCTVDSGAPYIWILEERGPRS